jgi:hypothetical protein
MVGRARLLDRRAAARAGLTRDNPRVKGKGKGEGGRVESLPPSPLPIPPFRRV